MFSKTSRIWWLKTRLDIYGLPFDCQQKVTQYKIYVIVSLKMSDRIPKLDGTLKSDGHAKVQWSVPKLDGVTSQSSMADLGWLIMSRGHNIRLVKVQNLFTPMHQLERMRSINKKVGLNLFELPLFMYFMRTVDGRDKYLNVKMVWLAFFSVPSDFRVTIALFRSTRH